VEGMESYCCSRVRSNLGGSFWRLRGKGKNGVTNAKIVSTAKKFARAASASNRNKRRLSIEQPRVLDAQSLFWGVLRSVNT